MISLTLLLVRGVALVVLVWAIFTENTHTDTFFFALSTVLGLFVLQLLVNIFNLRNVSTDRFWAFKRSEWRGKWRKKRI